MDAEWRVHGPRGSSNRTQPGQSRLISSRRLEISSRPPLPSPNDIENYSTSLRFFPSPSLSQGHAVVVVCIDPSTGLATFEGFLLSFHLVVDRRSYLEPLCHDLNFPRFSTRAIFLSLSLSRAERAKEKMLRDPQTVSDLLSRDSILENKKNKKKKNRFMKQLIQPRRNVKKKKGRKVERG